MRTALLALLVLAAAAAFAACGGGGGSSSSSTASTATTTTTTSTPSGSSSSSSQPPVVLQHAKASAETAADRRKAGRAAPFLKPEADNSVPTFGVEASGSQRASAEAALKAYLSARAKEDWPAACRHLAASVRKGFERLAKGKASSCAQVLAALSKGADLSDPLTGPLLSLRVHGASAFALFYGPHHQQYIVPMAREGNAWRPTQTAPIAYPPGAPPATSP
jgi:hypothetical protein